jgi:ATP-dependent Clp protease ATP-binding subunit ClpA
MNRLKTLWKSLAAASAGEGQDSAEAMNNFTPRAQQVLALARKEADRFNHNFVGTEHLLLGLIKLGQGVAVNVLQKLGLDLESVRREVEKQVGTGPDQKMMGNIPYTPRVKKVLALAQKEAKALNHTYVGTEHILLGLLREGDGVAARVLKNLDVDIEQTRREILKELDPNWSATLEDAQLSPSSTPPIPTEPESPPNEGSSRPQRESVDTTKRYDVYCTERTQEIVVYRNALFKGTKSLFPKNQFDTLSQFVELEQADGQTLFIAKYSIIRFCEPGVTPKPELG